VCNNKKTETELKNPLPRGFDTGRTLCTVCTLLAVLLLLSQMSGGLFA